MADVEKTDKSSKNTSVIIFVVLGVFLIIYLVYCFEAYQNGWFPFADYVQVKPENAVYPLGTVTPVSADDIEIAQETLKSAYQNYCDYYAHITDTIKLPSGQTLVDCKASN